MAHIPDGILSVPVLLAGAAISAGGVAMGLRGLDPARAPKAALLSATLFVASLIHLPAGLASVHLLLGGLAGIVLGWAAFPAFLVALVLQAVLFGFGGLAALGVNLADMAIPALAAGALFRLAWRGGSPRRAAWLGAAAGGGAVAATSVMMALALAASGREFETAARLAVLAHLPVAGIEAAFTGAAVALLARVKPEILARPA